MMLQYIMTSLPTDNKLHVKIKQYNNTLYTNQSN